MRFKYITKLGHFLSIFKTTNLTVCLWFSRISLVRHVSRQLSLQVFLSVESHSNCLTLLGYQSYLTSDLSAAATWSTPAAVNSDYHSPLQGSRSFRLARCTSVWASAVCHVLPWSFVRLQIGQALSLTRTPLPKVDRRRMYLHCRWSYHYLNCKSVIQAGALF